MCGERWRLGPRPGGVRRGDGPALDDAFKDGGVGREQAGAPGDDLGDAAHALEHGDIAVRRPLDLDAVGAHQAAAGGLPPISGPALKLEFGAG